MNTPLYARGGKKTIYALRNSKQAKNSENNKSMGTDGIPGGVYKILWAPLSPFIHEITNQINAGQTMPDTWGIERKRIFGKNITLGCNNYRPLCLTQIIYKTWHKAQSSRIARILHSLTSNSQFGYKYKLSAIDDIVKLERAPRKGSKSTEIIPMGLSKALDFVNR